MALLYISSEEMGIYLATEGMEQETPKAANLPTSFLFFLGFGMVINLISSFLSQEDIPWFLKSIAQIFGHVYFLLRISLTQNEVL